MIKDRIVTRWAKEVTPENAHREYPRPNMIRENWLNLNGLWDYAITPKDQSSVSNYDGEMLVPFAIESALSGVGKNVGSENRLWYRRSFNVPKNWKDQNVILHFGAVDWETTIWINDREIGSHKGGYDAFSFDITDALIDGDQEIVISVFDPTDDHTQPRGKQIKNPHGIWYTSVSGIWQTVWIEPVPKTSISRLKLTPDLDSSSLTIEVFGNELENAAISAIASANGDQIAKSTTSDSTIVLEIPNAKTWSPSHPFLYDLEVQLSIDDHDHDSVKSYFGMRKIEMKKDQNGRNRLFLNGDALFQIGPLDQGWWPDGLYTAPTDEALRYDLEFLKKAGFNMLRKHVKIEPTRLYYHCDRIGLLVWQDMPSGDRYIGGNDPDLDRTPESISQFEKEYLAMIDQFYNHPSIVVWVPFNEGWGQFDTARITALTKEYDPTRLVDSASGWTDRGTGDLYDIHSYPGPGDPKFEENRATVIGEFGGLGWAIEGHLWIDEGNWGYRNYDSADELRKQYEDLIRRLKPLIDDGVAAAIYTQTTDVEIEVNGLLTYDREIDKLGAEWLAGIHKIL